MEENQYQKETTSEKYSVVVPSIVYVFSLIIPGLALTIPAILLHWSKDYQLNHLYFIGTLGQSLMDLPAVILFLRMNRKSPAPADPKSRMASLILGLILAMILAGLRILLSGNLIEGRFMGGVPAFTQSLNLAPPWNVIASILALLAYGPGEAIFVVYLVLVFDKALGGSQRLFSRGVILTSILWALPHLFNIFYFGLGAIANALIMFFLGLIMGILLKRTRSSLGPIIFWTLVNGTSM
ncbi:MAG: CPBP family glutamic-type intramembrane protease [Anaerolineales bacterium]